MGNLLYYCTILILIATAWLHLIQWDSPYFEFYKLVTSATEKPLWLAQVNTYVGAFFTVCAVALVIRLKFIKHLLLASSVLLFLISIAGFIRHFPYLNEIMEHGIRFTTPFLLFLILQKRTQNLSLIIRLGIAATFVGHGIYAMNILPVPENFLALTTHILHCDEASARTFLLGAGILDLIVGVGLFIPKMTRFALMYCVFWGLVTAIARVWGNIHLPADEVFFRWLPEMLLRLANGLIPLWVLWTFYPKKNEG